ncbi:MAG: 4Fe-4S binding protein [Chitinispirillaceae bacterium]|nr:4Fe-4S binding protein [Chitinispirillaceae bacterium]
MKIAITSGGADLDGRVEARFGRCPYFIIVDPDTMAYEALENPNIALGGGAGIQSAQLMAEKEVAVVLTGNCGPNAFQVFGSAGIRVITGVSGSVRDAIEQYKSEAFSAAAGPNVASHFGMGTAASPMGQPDNISGGSMGVGGGFGMGRGMGMGGGRGMGGGGGRGMGGGGRGRGSGRGMGLGGGGRGMDMGGGRGMGDTVPVDFQQPFSDVQGMPAAPMNREQEINALKQQSALLQGQISQVNARLQELEGGTFASGLVAFVAAERCTACERCVSACPTGAIRIDGAVALINQDICTGCGQCVNACPRRAITLGSR